MVLQLLASPIFCFNITWEIQNVNMTDFNHLTTQYLSKHILVYWWKFPQFTCLSVYFRCICSKCRIRARTHKPTFTSFTRLQLSRVNVLLKSARDFNQSLFKSVHVIDAKLLAMLLDAPKHLSSRRVVWRPEIRNNMKSGAQQMTDLTSEMEHRVILVEHVTCDRQGRSQPRISGGTPASGRWARGGCEQMSPLPLRGVGGCDLRILCSFLIQNPAFWCSLWLQKWALPVFLSRPLCIGEMKTVGRGCWMRLEGPKIEAGRERCGFLGGGSKTHQLGGLAVM